MTRFLFAIVEIVLAPLTLLTALWIKVLATSGMHKTILARRIFLALDVWAMRDHYYQPLFNPKKHLRHSLRDVRDLHGINLNEAGQLALLGAFKYEHELKAFPLEKSELKGKLGYYYNNPSFLSGDSEYLYNMIRHFKPKKMVEIGSGNSTLMAYAAFLKNKEEDANYRYEHVCIEPYEQPWLEQLPVRVVRQRVELLDPTEIRSLQANDILFIDSSHIIRPQGDVLHEYLTLLPQLASGVLVHVHDIFTPRDYLDEWVLDEHRLWNEQYLLEAFLTENNSWEVLGALNYLRHAHREAMASKCPIFAQQPHREPGSFWMRKK